MKRYTLYEKRGNRWFKVSKRYFKSAALALEHFSFHLFVNDLTPCSMPMRTIRQVQGKGSRKVR